MNPLLQTHRQALLDLASRHGVTDLRVFGSMARGDSGPDSDLDLLVRPLPGTSLLDLGGAADGSPGPAGTAGRCGLGAGPRRGPAGAYPGGGRAAVKPTPESDREHIAHMLGCIARIRDYTQGKRAVFDGSSLVQDAVLRNLQTLTESCQHLSDGAKASEAGIDWRRLAGMRNILVHAYLGGIDAEAVWAVIERELPDWNRPSSGLRLAPTPGRRRRKAILNLNRFSVFNSE